MSTNYLAQVWPGVVRRRYGLGGYMVAQQTMDVEVLGELVHIEAGQKLSEDEALVYRGDVMHVFRTGETSGE